MKLQRTILLCMAFLALASGCDLDPRGGNDPWPTILSESDETSPATENQTSGRFPRTRSDARKAPDKAEEKNKAEERKPKDEEPKPASPPPTPSLQEIRNAAKQGSREGVEALLAPIVRQVNDLSERLAAVEGQLARLDGDTGATKAEAQALRRELHGRIDALARTMQHLATERNAADKALAESEARRQEATKETNKLRADLASLTRTTQELTRRLDNAQKKAEPERRTVESSPRPASPRVASWSTKNVKLPCGYEINSMNVPSGGTYVRCPNCGLLSYVR